MMVQILTVRYMLIFFFFLFKYILIMSWLDRAKSFCMLNRTDAFTAVCVMALDGLQGR
jgi:hypothetical protein